MTTSAPATSAGTERHGGLVLLAAVCFALGAPALLAGLAVAGATRWDTAARVPATLASVGSWAWVLLLAAMVLLGLAAVPATGRSRRLLGALVVLALVALAVQAVWLAPRFVGGAGAGGTGRGGLTVMTANLRYGAADAASVVRAVRDREVSLLALEEVTPGELARLRSAGLGTVLPHTAGRPSRGADGTMVLSRDPVTDAVPVDVSRGGVAVSVGGRRFLAVHLNDPLFHPTRWYADLTSLQRTVRAERARTGGPVVVAGDFNTTPDHAPFRRLLSRSGVRDGAEQAGSGLVPTWPSDRWRPFLVIDHVLTSDQLVVSRTDRVRLPGTDHLGLVARLSGAG